MREIEAGSLAFGDELSEPGIVNVAGEVASLDLAMPEARDYEQKRNEKNGEEVLAEESGGRERCVWLIGHSAMWPAANRCEQSCQASGS